MAGSAETPSSRRRAGKRLTKTPPSAPGKAAGNGAREARGVGWRQSAQPTRDYSARIARPGSHAEQGKLPLSVARASAGGAYARVARSTHAFSAHADRGREP